MANLHQHDHVACFGTHLGPADSHEGHNPKKNLTEWADQMLVPRVVGSNPGPYRVDFG